MRQIFVDSSYYIAVLNPRDSLKSRADKLRTELEIAMDVRFITTDAVLIETLTRVSGFGEYSRRQASDFVRVILGDTRVRVIPHDRALFEAALNLYARRLDKDYSMTDCMSMAICRAEGITDVLTADRDFQQEGFTILL